MNVTALRLPVTDPGVGSVTAAFHRPAHLDPRHPAVLLAPGAGGDLEVEGLVALARVLAELGHPVVRTNLPHHEAGRRAAPRAEQAVPAFAGLLTAAQEATGLPGRWVVGGRSYGARVATLAAAGGMETAGLLLQAYPLHPPGRPDRLRVAHWPEIRVACLFVVGDRDTFCDLALLRAALPGLPGPATVHVVPGADHSLRITRAVSPDGTAWPPARTVAALEPVLAAWLSELDG